jgi:bacterioferritin
MKVDAEVIRILNGLVTIELTAINQYLIHGQLYAHWGFAHLAEKARASWAEEHKDVEQLVARILFLEGTPDVATYHPIRIGDTATRALESTLTAEYESQKYVATSIEKLRQLGDHGTEELFREVLVGEESQIDWLETQLDLIRKLGEPLYLAQKL